MGVRLTTAEALVRFLAAQKIVDAKGKTVPLFGGVFAIFGHGNVAGLGPALHAHRNTLPTLRAHNEQAMALAAVAYAKTHARNRMMACTTSIGPGATNMVTAAAVAHVNRLPVLLLPGDVFADRRPDPVLQQVENFGDAAISANDVFRPVSRYWDRITRPEQILVSAPAALRVLLDPADCGPAVICLPQDVQAEAFDCPPEFFAERVHKIRRPQPDIDELAQAAAALKGAKKPMILVGGGVKFSGAERMLGDFAVKRGIPTAETQAGKGALAWDHPANAGALGVTGTGAANALAAEADVVLAVGTRLADFPTACAHRVPEPEAEAHSIECRRVRCGQARRSALRRRCARRGEGARRQARPLESAGCVDGEGRARNPHLEPRRGQGDRPRAGIAERRRRAGRGQSRGAGSSACDDLCGGRLAGRIAQAVARHGFGELPPRIRFLVHGLRDRGPASAPNSRHPSARSTCWSATARI